MNLFSGLNKVINPPLPRVFTGKRFGKGYRIAVITPTRASDLLFIRNTKQAQFKIKNLLKY
jgi:hypothetical protein